MSLPTYNPYKLTSFIPIPTSTFEDTQSILVLATKNETCSPQINTDILPSTILLKYSPFSKDVERNPDDDTIKWSLEMPIKTPLTQHGTTIAINLQLAGLITADLDNSDKIGISLFNTNRSVEAAYYLLGNGRIDSLLYMTNNEISNWYVSGHIDGDNIVYRFDDNLSLLATHVEIKGDTEKTIKISADYQNNLMYLFTQKKTSGTWVYILNTETLEQVSTFELPYNLTHVKFMKDGYNYIVGNDYKSTYISKLKYNSKEWEIKTKKTNVENDQYIRDVAVSIRQPYHLYVVTDNHFHIFDKSLELVKSIPLDRSQFNRKANPIITVDEENNILLGLKGESILFKVNLYDTKIILDNANDANDADDADNNADDLIINTETNNLTDIPGIVRLDTTPTRIDIKIENLQEELEEHVEEAQQKIDDEMNQINNEMNQMNNEMNETNKQLSSLQKKILTVVYLFIVSIIIFITVSAIVV